jgi:hypothetical protein
MDIFDHRRLLLAFSCAALMTAAACSNGVSVAHPSTNVEGRPMINIGTTNDGVSVAHPTTGDDVRIGGCRVFPRKDPWNTDISAYPVDPHSADYLANMHPATHVHPDFGSNPTYGIPWITVPQSQPFLPITFDDPQESNPGPYPFPPNVPIESGSDRHAIVVETGACLLYETYATKYLGPPPSNGFHAYSGALFAFDKKNPQRTDGWTSADAAGLAILPGLVKKSEADSGVINHAFRFTMSSTQSAFIHPAQHCTSGFPHSQYPYYPPMGLRVRLKASYDISSFTGDALAIAVALKKYGLLLADNGSDWYITGETNTSWDDNNLNQLKNIPGSAFEVVHTGPLILGYC